EYLKKYKAKEVIVNLAYAIGYDQPVQATAIVDGKEHKITDYDLSPNGVIDYLNLRRPIYENLTLKGILDIPL
ncbi:MAG TPA: methionine adenosyltransferase domain-containing protein, partial [Candidatus Saccharibacteria bacterium]|nr:methionine adenosyltransferase domain-containing protein [Candidatus Saccharibacteria bacterium]